MKTNKNLPRTTTIYNRGPWMKQPHLDCNPLCTEHLGVRDVLSWLMELYDRHVDHNNPSGEFPAENLTLLGLTGGPTSRFSPRFASEYLTMRVNALRTIIASGLIRIVEEGRTASRKMRFTDVTDIENLFGLSVAQNERTKGAEERTDGAEERTDGADLCNVGAQSTHDPAQILRRLKQCTVLVHPDLRPFETQVSIITSSDVSSGLVAQVQPGAASARAADADKRIPSANERTSERIPSASGAQSSANERTSAQNSAPTRARDQTHTQRHSQTQTQTQTNTQAKSQKKSCRASQPDQDFQTPAPPISSPDVLESHSLPRPGVFSPSPQIPTPPDSSPPISQHSNSYELSSNASLGEAGREGSSGVEKAEGSSDLAASGSPLSGAAPPLQLELTSPGVKAVQKTPCKKAPKEVSPELASAREFREHFTHLFKQAREGAEPLWDAKANAIVSQLVRLQGGVAEVKKRADRMFAMIGQWPVGLTPDLQTLRAHWDKFAPKPMHVEVIKKTQEDLRYEKRSEEIRNSPALAIMFEMNRIEREELAKKQAAKRKEEEEQAAKSYALCNKWSRSAADIPFLVRTNIPTLKEIYGEDGYIDWAAEHRPDFLTDFEKIEARFRAEEKAKKADVAAAVDSSDDGSVAPVTEQVPAHFRV